MQRKTLTVLCQAIAICALYVYGLPALQTSPDQPTQNNPTKKTAKPRKAKTTAAEPTTSKPATPAAEEKTAKPRKANRSAVEPTPSPAAAEEKAAKPRKTRKSAAEVIVPQPAAPVETRNRTIIIPKPTYTEPPAAGSANRYREIAPETTPPAGAYGMVWVNTDSGIYHKAGRWYGNTKSGKYMTEQDAIRAGYKPAMNEK
jgi:hypothetical protein